MIFKLIWTLKISLNVIAELTIVFFTNFLEMTSILFSGK